MHEPDDNLPGPVDGGAAPTCEDGRPGVGTWDDVHSGLRWFGTEFHSELTTRERCEQLTHEYWQWLREQGGGVAALADVSLHDAIPRSFHIDDDSIVLVVGVGDLQQGYSLATLTYAGAIAEDPAGALKPEPPRRWEWHNNEIDTAGSGYVHRIVASAGRREHALATITFASLSVTTNPSTAAEAGR